MDTIPEDEAAGIVKDIYADMRAVLGIPVVNLIYRHIATLPGCLEWSWATLRPLYASGAIGRSAQRLAARVALPPLPRLSPAVLAAVGVNPESIRAVLRTLDTYNRANPMNLIALTVLLADMEGRVPPRANTGRSVAPRGAPGAAPAQPDDALPPLLAVERMPPDTAALVRELAAIGVEEGGVAMPTLWRHLAHWPGYLALALTLLRPLEANGWLGEAIEALRQRKEELARETQAALRGGHDVARPGAAAGAELQAVVRRFTGGLIVRMIPIGQVLRATLPEIAIPG